MSDPLEPPVDPAAKRRNAALLAAGVLCAMGLWFSASAVVPQLAEEWGLDGRGKAWMTMSVQVGFVAGTLLSALLNLADRVEARVLVAASALLGAAANAAIPLSGAGPRSALALRFLTGVLMAGIYPPGMKLMATWFKADRGLGIGLLVGALTVGSAMPHLLNATALFGTAGMPPWRPVLLTSSLLAVLGGILVHHFVRAGPYLAASAPFDWRFAISTLAYKPTRLANYGYLGHMWELYAMWTWVPIFLMASYREAAWSPSAARAAGFAVIAAGGIGSVLAGLFADRLGRTATAIASLIVSGACCLAAGPLFARPGVLTAVCLVWGFAVVADSAQFSAAVSELTDPRYVGTALTVQTCLGFLLTLVTIAWVPALLQATGWRHVFLLLAPGPVFGILSMLRLRRLPEAVRMASGHR